MTAPAAWKSNVKFTWSGTGTGNVVAAGAANASFELPGASLDGLLIDYEITNIDVVDSNGLSTEREVGRGTWTNATSTLSRSDGAPADANSAGIISGSNGNNRVNFSAGTKLVSITPLGESVAARVEGLAGGTFDPTDIQINSAARLHDTYTQSGPVTFTLNNTASTFNLGLVQVPFTSNGGALTWDADLVHAVTGLNADLPASLPAGTQTLIFQYDATLDRGLVFLSVRDALAADLGAFNPAAVAIDQNKGIHSDYTQSGAVTFTLSSGTANGGEILVPFISDGGALTWSAQFVSGVTGSNSDLPATLPSGQQTLIFQRDVTADVVRVFLAQSTAAEVSYDNTTSGLAATNVKAALDELTSEKANLSGGNSWMGTQDYNGATVQGGADLVITRGAASSQPTVAESGAWITSDGAITIPNTKVGWKCFLELGGDHDITFNSQTYDTGTGAAGDIYQILVKSASVIRMSPVTPAADVITEADFI